MAKLNVNPTRMELSRLKIRLKTAVRGHKLLKDKQDELMRQFIDMIKKNIMSVNVPQMTFVKENEGNQGMIYPYGYAQTSADLDDAIDGLSSVMDNLLELAEVEKACQLMADEVEKTRRRVNALEYMTIPQLKETIRFIQMKLDENERGSITRLMKVKDMMSKKEA